MKINPLFKLTNLGYEIRYLKKQVQIFKNNNLVFSIDKYYNPNDFGYYKELEEFIEVVEKERKE